jgi:hypothetical protein
MRQMLCEYTEARLVAVLDNVDAEHVRDVWEEASSRARAGDTPEAIEVLQRLDKRKSGAQVRDRFWGQGAHRRAARACHDPWLP